MEKPFDYKCNCINCKASNSRDMMAENTFSALTNELCDINKRYEYHVNTSNLYQTINLPKRFEHPYMFNGYGNQRKDKHPAFRTSNSDYGLLPPNAHTVPQTYFPRSNEFSTVLAKCGMYRNYSLNTGVDKSNV